MEWNKSAKEAFSKNQLRGIEDFLTFRGGDMKTTGWFVYNFTIEPAYVEMARTVYKNGEMGGTVHITLENGYQCKASPGVDFFTDELLAVRAARKNLTLAMRPYIDQGNKLIEREKAILDDLNEV